MRVLKDVSGNNCKITRCAMQLINLNLIAQNYVFLTRATLSHRGTGVGFVAAAVSMPMGGCRARRPVVVDIVSVTVEPAVL